jgi:hypothetical protein
MGRQSAFNQLLLPGPSGAYLDLPPAVVTKNNAPSEACDDDGDQTNPRIVSYVLQFGIWTTRKSGSPVVRL